MDFFASLESSIRSAKLNGSLVCAEMDANNKVGKENISQDPNNISANGQMLMDIVNRNGLIIVNSTSKCFGTITRVRKTSLSEEKSVIDYFIVCQEFYDLISSMEIDEGRKYVLTKYSTRKGIQQIRESDHNVLFCYLNIKWDKRIPVKRKEVFNLKDKEGLSQFSELTSNCPKLIDVSLNSSNFLKDAEKWLKEIENIKHKSFKKIRITGKAKPQNEELETLFKSKQELRDKLIGIETPVLKSKMEENITIIESEIFSIMC